MSLASYSIACRFCLQMDSTYYDFSTDNGIQKQIQTFFTLNKDPQLSHYVCITCHRSLSQAIDFVETVRHNQDFLNQLLRTVPLEIAPAAATTTTESSTCINFDTSVADEQPPPVSHVDECDEATAEEPVPPRKSAQRKRKKNPKGKTDALIRSHMALYCDVCGDQSEPHEDFSKLVKHFREDHDGMRGYAVCCGRKFLRKAQLLDHVILHANPNAYRCNECGHRSRSAVLLKFHQKQHSQTERRYACDICDGTFVTKSQLYNHMAKHGVKRHECDLCGKAFGHKFTLTKHRLTHDELVKFICEICAKPLSSESYLKAHIRTHHENLSNKSQCSFCGKWFKNAETLRSHFNAHHKDQREHHCELCDKQYSTGSGLMTHIRMVHQKEPKHSCEQCDKKFHKKSILKEHVKRSHSGPTPRAMFQCEFCDKEYLHSNNYFFHRKQAHPEEYAQLRRDRENQREGLTEGEGNSTAQ